MGIIRAAVNAVHGSLADQWLETVEPYEMGEHTVFTEGILVRKGQNKKGSQTISNGSVIHVYDNQFMMLVDGGKIIDYTAEPGYFTVDQSSSPSMFSGSLDAAVKDTFERLKFGGQTPHEQRVFYINLQEIKGIKFGTRNPVNYFDQFYNAELFLRAHGSYSIRIVDPLRFYAEAVPRVQKGPADALQHPPGLTFIWDSGVRLSGRSSRRCNGRSPLPACPRWVPGRCPDDGSSRTERI